MTRQLSPTDSATHQQKVASDPAASAWVSANAGSGKTHVLVNRVIRLMLAGCPPDRILCLTFTKAAASEMANRLFRLLGEWTGLDDSELGQRIAGLGETAADSSTLLRARRLFANALDTPGGLKIQTIHAFCESLLQRFPLEADVAPGFDVLDSRTAEDLLDQVRGELLVAAETDPGSAIGGALSVAVERLSEFSFDLVLRELLASRSAFRSAIPSSDRIEAAVDHIREEFGLEPDATAASIMEQSASLGDDQRLNYVRVAEALRTGGKTDRTAADRVDGLLSASDNQTRFQCLQSLLLTRKGDPRARLMTKKPAEGFPEALEWLQSEQDRLVSALQRYRAAITVETTAALMLIADRVIAGYELAKRRRAALDYDDLIDRTVALFDRSEAAWVLYKLDGGLDHILVDEAQDTSPEQWEVVRNLADEFFAGEGARELVRTMFAVGDEKQSIYSFQGAKPAEFDRMKRYFARRAEAAQRRFEAVPLIVSFRSTPAVLGAVDRVFQTPDAASGLGRDADRIVHEAVRQGDAGLIEIWPTVVPEDGDEEHDPWRAPVDRVGQQSPRIRLAERIAVRISGWVNKGGETLEARGRAIRPGDILILVRRRDVFADAMVRSLKRRGVPVAGADRLILTGHIAVLDLLALIRFVLMPEDDLTLATLLKSPLVEKTDGGWIDDEDLFRLAHGRPGSLHSALRDSLDGQSEFRSAFDRLEAWRVLGTRMPPFEFLNTVLGRDGARERFIRRLGAEANDPIDEFVGLALDYETDKTPTLEGFLSWVSEAETEIKRDMDHGRDEVRIMTVHGAKGLEANVVFLPDTCTVPAGHHDPSILYVKTEDGGGDPALPVWAARKANDTPSLAAERERLHAERRDEYHRLLYVAMTRARDRLYICGYEGVRGRDEGCWYDLVAHALEGNAVAAECPDGMPVLRIAGRQERAVSAEDGPVERRDLPARPPEWAFAQAPAEPRVLRPIAPSRLEAIEVDGTPVYGDDQPVTSPLDAGDETRFMRGRLIHKLLQLLPDVAVSQRADRAHAFLDGRAEHLSPEERSRIAIEVLDILDDGRFADLFAEGSRAEVPLVATLPLEGPDGRPLVISGQVDRLVVTGEDVRIVDYKTNRPPPSSVDGVAPLYVRQMAAYRIALASVFPGKTARAFLLWTDGPNIMEIPQSMMERELGVVLER